MPYYIENHFNSTQNNYQFAKSLNSFYTYVDTLCSSGLKILLYGAGTVSQIVSKMYSSNIEVIIDKNNYDFTINNIYVDHPNNIKNYTYDIILITVLGREKEIIHNLVEQFEINIKDIRVFEIQETTEVSEEEKELILLKHQKTMQCNFNMPPYNITNNFQTMNLIFFMGLGDYLFVTPILKEIKSINPNTIINAYVSKNTDTSNSALVYDMLIQDPYIDKVCYYEGQIGNRWETYNFKDAIRQIDTDGSTIYPMIFAHTQKNSIHRVDEIYKTFGLNCNTIYKPLLHFQKENYLASEKISQFIDMQNKKVVFLHLEARHCNYNYTMYNQLIKQLIDNDLFVVFISPEIFLENYKKESFFHLEIGRYQIYESFAFIESIKSEKYMIAINSVMLHLSSALDIPALGLYIFKNSTQTRQTFYNNIQVLTIDKECYEFLPSENVTLIDENDVELLNGYLVNYSPTIILDKFISLVLHQ